jgi:protein O-GlcNAc transferase
MFVTKMQRLVPWTLFLVLHVALCGQQQLAVGVDGQVEALSPEIKVQIANLERKALAIGYHDPQFQSIWKQVLKLNPRSGSANFNLAILALDTQREERREEGIVYLERAFDPKAVDIPIPMPSQDGMTLAMLVARYRWEQRNYDVAYSFMSMARQAAEDLGEENVCAEIFLATLLPECPNTTQQADASLERYMVAAEAFLKKYRTVKPTMDEQKLGKTVAGTAEDPYIFCTTNLFHLISYHRSNVAKAAHLRHQMVARVWPQLEYTSTNVRYYDGETKTCTTQKIKLGIASGFLIPKSSVAADFGKTLQRLDRSVFDITYIHFCAKANCKTDAFVNVHEQDKLMTFKRNDNDIMNGAWPTRFFSSLEALNLDILLYLDLTMSPHASRVAMARLAPVQATTHGHPVTSGIPAVDYYISWGAAELPEAQDHYLEQLVLLNSTVPHQYYEKRHDENGKSVVNGGLYKPLAKRSNYAFRTIPERGNWYTCMQQPHKFMPEMDSLICGILQKDPDGRIILHAAKSPMVKQSFLARLRNAGCDLERIHFLPMQPHHTLLALYMVSTIMLDSYPAGGCTTTREILELGKAVVTLPASRLGGRWSYAYYQILGDEDLNSKVIASSEQDYIDKAVALGTTQELRDKVEAKIRENLHKLYEQDEAVRSWETVLLQIAPVERKEVC